MLFDSHTHLNASQFDVDRDEIYSKLLTEGVLVINIGTDFVDSELAVSLAEKYNNSYASIGIHPEFAGKKFFDQTMFEKLIKSSSRVVAVGETGLDYYWIQEGEGIEDDNLIGKQKQLFRSHIEFAISHKKALVIHARSGKKENCLRDAYDDVYTILKEYKKDLCGGSMHCFGGTALQAKAFEDLGFGIGITGIITFDKTGMLSEIVKNISKDNILVETDAPFLAPVPYRGSRNNPLYITSIIEKIAEIKGLSVSEISELTYKNTLRLFGISNE